MASDSYPIDNPPMQLDTPGPRELREREKSAVREAITLVCENGAGKLQGWLDKIEVQEGAKAAFDSFIKLLEFSQPKLQRVTVQDPAGNAPKQPIINVTFAPPPTMKIVESFEDITPEPLEDRDD